MTAPRLSEIAQAGRWAIAAMFFINGFVVGSWAPQIPVLVSRLGISEFTLGLLILGFGLGAITAMAGAGVLIARNGSRWTVRLFASALVFTLLLVALSPGVASVAVALFVFGGSIGAMDVAMNSNAVVVEQKLGRAVMSSSHGFWSLGGFAGGALGGSLIERLGHVGHAAAVSVLAAMVVGAAFRHVVADEAPAQAAERKFVFPRQANVYIVGALALICMNSEGAVLDWAALYLKQEMGAPLSTAGFAFAGFSGAMAIMRFVGDGIRNRFGAVKTFRVSAVIAAAGMLVAGLAPTPWLAIGAFSVSGLGIANMVPILFSAAGNQPGIGSGAGMSVVTTMGYAGILVAPSMIGFIGGEFGFVPVYVAVALLLVVVFLMSGITHTADMNRETVKDPLPI